jgi:membrane protease YdiL (CAAX protease family)
MCVYLSAPFLFLSRDRGRGDGTWLDALAILWIWLPVELGPVRRLLAGPGNNSFNYAFAQALALNMGLIAFGAWRRLPGIGYQLEFNRRNVRTALLAFVAFAGIAIPLGFAIRFIEYSFEVRKLMLAPLALLGIYLSIALPEEVLFRGLIQNWCQRIMHGRIRGLIIGSIVFGASHLNNGPLQPNYRYFLMAAIAGLFYGAFWQRTGTVAAAAITHALVDTAWTVFFR